MLRIQSILKNVKRSHNICGISSNLLNLNNYFTGTIRYNICATKTSTWDESSIKEGQNIEGFSVKRISKIPEFYLTAIELKHEDTGAEHVHLFREDSNNAFAVGFRTTPFNSTGVPHILEHLCTCGSEKYPCRDPYFKMLCRSMATYMNAVTGPDFTMYPFSTQNHRDYMNLMSVYLDAVFKPILRKTDFLQEAWRLEHRDVDDPNSPIVFKGVVFNEMKGVFSDNQSIFSENIMKEILPSHCYGVISGGDPLEIPLLTYEDLVKFHTNHYHPSNAKLYSYGNFPIAETLKFINNEYLSGYGKNDKMFSDETVVPPEPRWSSEKRKNISCRLDKMANLEKQSSIAISHACGDICDVYETFVMNILSELLINGPNSPLYRTLLEPNVGSGFIPATGYTMQSKTTYFTVGLQGLRPCDFDWMEDTFNRTINDVIKRGFDKRNIDAVLHSVELTVKHQSADFGLGVLFGITTPWIHDADIVQCINVNEHVTKFKKSIEENPHFLQDYVVKYFCKNPHRLILTMSPDPGYDEKLLSFENNLLNDKICNLSGEGNDAVYKQGLLLREEQAKVEDISCLPTLRISDLRKDVDKVDLIDMYVSGCPLQVCLQPTNGLTYFYGCLGIENMPGKNKDLVPLFCYIADKMGTLNTDFRKFDQEVLLTTRGLDFRYHNSESLKHTDIFEEGILISSVCLDRNSAKMFHLWSDVFNYMSGSVFENKERFQTLLSTLASNYLNGIPHNGHHYAMLSSASAVCSSSKRKEICGGLTFVRKLQEISQPSKIDGSLIIMKDIASAVLNRQSFRAAINLMPQSKNEVINDFKSFCESIGGSCEQNITINNKFINKSFERNLNLGFHHVIPSQVSFTSKSVLTVPYTHEEFAALRLLSRILTLKYCIPEVREKGGAYGAGANISPGGVFSFYSYRDPNPTITFHVFDNAQNWIFNNKFSERDLEEAKLGVFQSVDAPVPPGNKGIDQFLSGLDDETLQKHRLALMNLNSENLYNVASKYLGCDISSQQGRALIGPYNEEVIGRRGELWTVIK